MSRSARLAALALTVFLAATVGRASARTVSGKVETPNGFAWSYGYDTALRGQDIRLRVGIHLVPAAGVSPAALERARARWKPVIERVWSGHLAAVTPQGEVHPITLEVDFRGPGFHHQVVVRPGAGGTDELDWRLLDSPRVLAHEVGHMLGAFDDYRGGARPPDSIADPESVMASGAPGEEIRPRHLRTLLPWLQKQAGLADCRLERWDAGLSEAGALSLGTATSRATLRGIDGERP